MATPFSGKDGTLQTYNAKTGVDNNITGWTLTLTDSAPGTAHSGSGGWVASFAGVRSWSASVDLLADTAQSTNAPPEVGDAITALKLFDGQNTYTASDISTSGQVGVINSASYSCDVAGGGLMTVSVSITGSGSMAITT